MPSPTQLPPAGEFVFLNSNGPSDSNAKQAARRTVRSRAAAHSHRVAPRKGLKAARYKPRDHEKTELPARTVAALTRGEIPLSSQSEVAVAGKGKGRLLTDPRPMRRVAIEDMLSPIDSKIEAADEEISRDDTLAPLSADVSRYVRFPPIPSLTYMAAGKVDPFRTYPVQYQGWFGWLLELWYDFILPRAKNMVKMSQRQLAEYAVWSKRLELTEPALFYMSLFLATGIPVSQGKFPLPAAIWLRGQTVKALNEALADPKRALSNAVISAVGKAALHEHIYGDKKICHEVHRPAQQRMIAMRGGVENLGLPVTTLQLMIWYDQLMASESDTPAYFADVPRRMGLQSFSHEEAISVTNTASPQRHQHPGYGQESRQMSNSYNSMPETRESDNFSSGFRTHSSSPMTTSGEASSYNIKSE